MALGYEDLNDPHRLRGEVALQTAVGRDRALASAATLCRFENRAGRAAAWQIHEVLVDRFIDSFKDEPTELILDFDATDDAVHGEQTGDFFHGFTPVLFLAAVRVLRRSILVSYLRPSNIDAAKHSWAILSLLVKRLRRAWPRYGSSSEAIRGFAVGSSCAGATVTMWTTSWE